MRLKKQQFGLRLLMDVFIVNIISDFFDIPLSKLDYYMLHCRRRDGRVDYCGCLENSWVNSPGGSNPSPSVKVRFGEAFYLLGCRNLYRNVCSRLLH
jgi:hypothetical protein